MISPEEQSTSEQHSRMHQDSVAAALNGRPEPKLTPEQETLEQWSGLGIPESDPEGIAKRLGVELLPLKGAKEGNEHLIYRTAKRLWTPSVVVKVDRIPVDEELSRERFFVHDTVRTVFPHTFPRMLTSFSFPEEGSGIILERLKKHPQADEALAQSSQGDKALLRKITKYPFEPVEELWQETGIPYFLDLTKPSNLWVDKKGRRIMMDGIFVDGEDLVEAKDTIVNFMDRHTGATNRSRTWRNPSHPHYTRRAIKRVERNLNALKVISTQ